MNALYAGVDIGGTNTALGLFDADMNLLGRNSIPTAGPEDKLGSVAQAPFLDRLGAALRTLIKDCGGAGVLAGIGIDSPGRVMSGTGIIYTASNLGWKEMRIKDEMQRRFSVPICVEHDVRAFVRGEAAFGAAAGYSDVIGVTIGTGVATGIISGGKVLSGSYGGAGEIGHDSVPGVDWLCTCGKTGCLETVVSSGGISRAATEAVAAGAIPSLSRIAGDISPEMLSRACALGDEGAKAVYSRAAEMLGRKLATFCYALEPEVIVVGGGVAKAGKWLFEPLGQTLEKLCPSKKPRLLPAALEDGLANIMGVAQMIKSEQEKG